MTEVIFEHDDDDGFGVKETLDVDFWTGRELREMLSDEDELDDFQKISLFNIVSIFTTEDRGRSVLCACCENSLPRRVVVPAKAAVVWANPRLETETIVHRTAGLVICRSCVRKGPSHVQQEVLTRMWKVWPRALAIRVRHDLDAKKEGTSE